MWRDADRWGNRPRGPLKEECKNDLTQRLRPLLKMKAFPLIKHCTLLCAFIKNAITYNGFQGLIMNNADVRGFHVSRFVQRLVRPRLQTLFRTAEEGTC